MEKNRYIFIRAIEITAEDEDEALEKLEEHLAEEGREYFIENWALAFQSPVII
jgi:hypothetical protein